jgi:hypothetical protein
MQTKPKAFACEAPGVKKKRPIPPRDEHRELRCTCGSLIARLVAGGVELKCRRCKRSIVVPLESGDGEPDPTAEGSR